MAVTFYVGAGLNLGPPEKINQYFWPLGTSLKPQKNQIRNNSIEKINLYPSLLNSFNTADNL